MVTKYARRKLLTPLFLAVGSLVLAAQQPRSAPAAKDFLPAGPFVFQPGAIHPTYMDAFSVRPVVTSPDGKLGVTVTGPKKSYEAWVTINPTAFPDGPVQVWPLQASADVLWRPDSQSFALTDNRYANGSYVLICGTEFRMGEDERGLGVPIVDLTPIVQDAFEDRVQKYYGLSYYQTDTLLFYAKALRWIGDDNLLIGISARTQGPAKFPNRGIKDWDFAYVVDFPNKKVVRELDKDKLFSEYKIRVQE